MPLKFPFSASDTKIQRARKHMAELEAEIAEFIGNGPAKFHTRIANKSGVLGFEIQADLSGPPESMGAIIGDVVHNLRAALDLAACEMVRAMGQSEKDVYFPFSDKAEDLDNMISKRHFDRAGPDAVALLKNWQPYKSGDTGLRVIHDLDIQDKHRALIPQVMHAASPVVRLWDDDRTFNPTIMGDPNVASETKLVFPTDSGPQGRELVPTLRELAQLVEDVVAAFRVLANKNIDGRPTALP